MKTFLNHVSSEAGWNDAARVNVLLDFLGSLVKEGKIDISDFEDYLDERVADEKSMGDEEPEVIKARCKVIVEKYKDTMDPSCTVILEEHYGNGIDYWKDGHKVHVIRGLQQEFKCTLSTATTIAQILFGEKKG